MTREEAIKNEDVQKAIDYFNEVLPYMGGDRGLPHFATAIAALESAQDGWVAECLYCGNSTVKINAHRHYRDLVMREDVPVNYCPNCGRPLPALPKEVPNGPDR